jgi:sn-glycerol 3-phosphate transport system ATP-binding protein
MATITLTDIRKSYGKTEVIHGVSIEVADGEFVVIVGPSGCGKSTLLRMVAGLEAITSGEVEIGGRVVNGLEPRERDIAMVFQNYALYPHMTVFDNMAYGLKIAGVPKPELKERVAKAAKMLDLEPYLDRKPRALSGGQRQRVQNEQIELFGNSERQWNRVDAKEYIRKLVYIWENYPL